MPSERRPVVCRSVLSARSPSAHGLPGRFAPDAPLQTAFVYVKIVLDTQNCILFCVFEIFIWDFYAKSIFDVCWILPSLLLRGAWIEILNSVSTPPVSCVAPLAGSVDRNWTTPFYRTCKVPSLPLRGAWIEIIVHKKQRGKKYVAPLAGSVDRNGKLLPWEEFLADLRTFPAVARSGSSGLP